MSLNVTQQTPNAFDILGKKWNGEIINTLLESKVPLRFTQISSVVTACSERVLTQRLKELESVGIINRISYPGTNKIDYQLTTKGYAMKDFMSSINSWANDYM
ncbi:MAG: helix-turn-helix transcriptional regulator [Lactobacillaceae bacterium]|jgi:DNA-binding HxlR family transcriptional regulator|nr:helix-turn-helix transcriptional regulator [Lactobacillaceae bacterium]